MEKCNLFKKTKNGHGEPTKVFVHLFQKVADSKGRAFGRVPQDAKHLFVQKDQEGSPNSPVDCWGVGNPIKGFPDGPRCGPFLLCPPFYFAFATNSHSMKL